MNKVWFVARNELLEIFRNKVLVFITFGLPVLLWLVFLGVSAIGESATESAQTAATTETEAATQGFVDKSGIIKNIPAQVPEEALKPFADEAKARRALETGKISGFYIVPPDYLETGDLVAVRSEFRLRSAEDEAGLMDWLLLYNLIDADLQFISRLKVPMELDRTDLALEAQGEETIVDDTPLQKWFPFAMVLMFFSLIAGSAEPLLRSVAREKENRVMEILMTSITPRQLLTGKTIGHGLFSLLQILIWVGGASSLLWAAGRQFTLPPGVTLPPSIIVWAIFFTLFGFALYASLMAGAGAMISNMKEVMPASWAAMAPLIVSYALSVQTLENPHHPLPTALSLFPLTSPVAMLMRLLGGGIPLWHPVVALALLAATTYFVNRAAAKLFRAQNLLSGQSFSVKRFYRTLLTRA